MTDAPKTRLLDAIKMHVPFDGWTQPAFEAALADTGIDPVVAKALCPRGAMDLAVAFHQEGDAAMVQQMAAPEMQSLKIREKITQAVRTRLELVEDKELVRRGTTLFSLPQYAAEGTKLIWQTCDAIWNAIGDSSDDVNWYTKRATLAGVYSATVLYWLGDDSEGQEATWAFLDRRIENVMQIEKAKAKVRNSPFLSKLMAGPNAVLSHIKAPSRLNRDGLPGHMSAKTDS